MTEFNVLIDKHHRIHMIRTVVQVGEETMKSRTKRFNGKTLSEFITQMSPEQEDQCKVIVYLTED